MPAWCGFADEPRSQMKNLSKKGLQKLQKDLLGLDPDARFVKLDVLNEAVKYSSEIIQHTVWL